VNSYVKQTAPVTIDHNLYFSSVSSSVSNWVWNASSFTGFSGSAPAWQSTGNDADSTYADPLFVNLTTPDLHVSASSPAVNKGNTSLGASVFGSYDFAGNARVQGTNVDIGAYEQ